MTAKEERRGGETDGSAEEGGVTEGRRCHSKGMVYREAGVTEREAGWGRDI